MYKAKFWLKFETLEKFNHIMAAYFGVPLTAEVQQCQILPVALTMIFENQVKVQWSRNFNLHRGVSLDPTN